MANFKTICWRWACTIVFVAEVLLLLVQAIVISLPLLIIGGMFTWNITDEKPPKDDSISDDPEEGSFYQRLLV